jgi:hypothetical protein
MGKEFRRQFIIATGKLEGNFASDEGGRWRGCGSNRKLKNPQRCCGLLRLLIIRNLEFPNHGCVQ